MIDCDRGHILYYAWDEAGRPPRRGPFAFCDTGPFNDDGTLKRRGEFLEDGLDVYFTVCAELAETGERVNMLSDFAFNNRTEARAFVSCDRCREWIDTWDAADAERATWPQHITCAICGVDHGRSCTGSATQAHDCAASLIRTPNNIWIVGHYGSTHFDMYKMKVTTLPEGVPDVINPICDTCIQRWIDAGHLEEPVEYTIGSGFVIDLDAPPHSANSAKL